MSLSSEHGRTSGHSPQCEVYVVELPDRARLFHSAREARSYRAFRESCMDEDHRLQTETESEAGRSAQYSGSGQDQVGTGIRPASLRLVKDSPAQHVVQYEATEYAVDRKGDAVSHRVTVRERRGPGPQIGDECAYCSKRSVGLIVNAYASQTGSPFSLPTRAREGGIWDNRQVSEDGLTVTWTYPACAAHLDEFADEVLEVSA